MWFDPDGREMTRPEWEAADGRSLAVFLDGDHWRCSSAATSPVVDDSLLLLVNAAAADVAFVLPDARYATEWSTELDTADPADPPARITHRPAKSLTVAPRTVVLLRSTSHTATPEVGITGG